MLCSNCFADLPEGSTYCGRCSSSSVYPSGLQSESKVGPPKGFDFGFLDASPEANPHQGLFAVKTGQRFGLATRAYRFIGYLLDGVLSFFLLGIGWWIWFILVAPRGQTPAKHLLKMQTVNELTGRPSTATTLFRYLSISALAWILIPFTVLGFFSIPYAFALVLTVLETIAVTVPIVDALLIFGNRQKRLVDMVFKTKVIRF